MLPATEQETNDVIEYITWQAPDVTVEMLQKVYSENVLHVCHNIWDVHTDKGRWWVITEPTNLYSQDQFPNMDLALTFHVGLCLRIPRSEKQKLSALPVEPFAEAYRYLEEASDALQHAEEVADYQAIGVRCREALLAFAAAAQMVLPWKSTDEAPKKADMKGWTDHICTVTMPGSTHENRRHLFKNLLDSAWKFANWLTHTKGSKWHDAEAGFSVTENAIGLATSAVIRHIRGVPDQCPACGSHRLSPERGYRDDMPDVEWERPACTKCGWVGEPVKIESVPQVPEEPRQAPEGECIEPSIPLRKLLRPPTSSES
ncbi:hypothetical protein [Cupriavidus sp. 8B]